MKMTGLLFLLLIGTFRLAAQTPADYPVNIHVSSSYYYWEAGLGKLRLDATIDGKKYVLQSYYAGYLLTPGDFKAKLVKDQHNSSYEFSQKYKVLFPDHKTRDFDVMKISD